MKRYGNGCPQLLSEVSNAWQTPPSLAGGGVLSPGEVVLMGAKLDLAEPEMMALACYLSDTERVALHQLRVAPARCRYVAGRLMLRHVLAHYIGCEISAVAYDYGTHGKPALASSLRGGGASLAAIAFNLSHAGDYVVCAVAREGLLGVDVEQITRKVEMKVLADRFFAAEEACRIKACKEEEQALPLLFFRTWTLKEAFIKAIGLGLSFPLQDFAVGFEDDCSQAQLLRVISPWQEQDWSLWSFLLPKSDSIAALAFDRPVTQLTLFASPFSNYMSQSFRSIA